MTELPACYKTEVGVYGGTPYFIVPICLSPLSSNQAVFQSKPQVRLASFGLKPQGHSFEGNPPSMFIISPVMNLESLQDKKSTALAMSSGYPVPSRI